MKGQLSFFEEEPIHVLLSLREEYYVAITNGTKKYEYRTRYLKEPSVAYIYVSKTKKKIVAKIEFGEPIIGNAKQISALAEQEEPGCYEAMMEYFYNDVGYAIPIKKVTPIEEVSLDELKDLFPDFIVPQSYYILDKKPKILKYLKTKELITKEYENSR